MAERQPESTPPEVTKQPEATPESTPPKVTKQPESTTEPIPPKVTKQPTFKEQLDQAAAGARNNGNGAVQSTLDTIIDKVTDYVPAAGNVLNSLRSKDAEAEKAKAESEAEAKENSAKVEDENTLQRPLHDHCIEDFLREQHRSKKDVLQQAGK